MFIKHSYRNFSDSTRFVFNQGPERPTPTEAEKPKGDTNDNGCNVYDRDCNDSRLQSFNRQVVAEQLKALSMNKNDDITDNTTTSSRKNHSGIPTLDGAGYEKSVTDRLNQKETIILNRVADIDAELAKRKGERTNLISDLQSEKIELLNILTREKRIKRR